MRIDGVKFLKTPTTTTTTDYNNNNNLGHWHILQNDCMHEILSITVQDDRVIIGCNDCKQTWRDYLND